MSATIPDQLTLGRPDQVAVIFGRRVNRRTPGRFHTKIFNLGVEPAIQIHYRASKVKQYFKEGRALRTETTDQRHPRLRDRPAASPTENWNALINIGHQINQRLLNHQLDACQCAPDATTLERGLGGALLAPAVLSIITTTFNNGTDRAKALVIWSAIAAGGGAVGLLLGGVLTDLASWRWIFFVNVPVGIALVVATVRFVPESRSELTQRTFDLPGAVTVTAGLVVLVFAIVKSNSYGWGSSKTIGLLATGVVLLAGFLAIERHSPAPLMRLGIFRLRGLAAADITLLLTAAAVFATFFFVSLYLQQILGYRPLTAGAAFLPLSAGIATGATVARKLVPRLGVHVVPVIGLALATAGMIVLSQVPVNGRYVSDLLPGLLPLGLGLGLTFVPITLAGTSEVSGEDAGLASGLLNTAQQVGGSIGLAVLSTFAASRTTSLLHGPVTAGLVLGARVSGFHVAFIAAALLLGAAWTVAALQLRIRGVREVKRVDVPADLAARAVGCAQCAPVAVTSTSGRSVAA